MTASPFRARRRRHAVDVEPMNTRNDDDDADAEQGWLGRVTYRSAAVYAGCRNARPKISPSPCGGKKQQRYG